MRRTWIMLAVSAGILADARASSILLGSNPGGSEAISILATDGSPIGTIGSAGDSGAALDGAGRVFSLSPTATQTTISIFTSLGSPLSSFMFNSGIDNGLGAPGFLEDAAFGGGNTLWVSGYNGYVYHIDLAGHILSSFDSGSPYTGIATNGTHLFTTSGLGGGNIYERDLNGAVVSTISTTLNDTLGIGYDPGSHTLWVGGFDTLTHLASDGSPLAAFPILGVHNGVEVGDLGTITSGVPEPASVGFVFGGLILLACIKGGPRNWRRQVLTGVALLVASSTTYAAVTITALRPSAFSPQHVGTVVTWTANASDPTTGSHLWYRFRLRPMSGNFETIVDYGPSNILTYTPVLTEGSYEIEVSVRNITNGSTAARTASFTFAPRATTHPVVSATTNPLVALYSAPACGAGKMIRVRFKLHTDVSYNSTNLVPCSASTTTNILVAGMYASSTYDMKQDVIQGPSIVSGPTLTFNTGAPPANPDFTVLTPLQPGASVNDGVLINTPLPGGVFHAPFATDLAGRLLWYYPGTLDNPFRPEPGENAVASYGGGTNFEISGFREFDLAGHTLKESNVARVNEQLTAMGFETVNVFHHEVRRLPDGDFLMLSMAERLDTVQGAGVDVLGDLILLVDGHDLHVKWVWDSFRHLDVSRGPVLGETCQNGQAGCVVVKAPVAVDWTHGNSVAPTPDGNLLYSSRHQDFVYKIAFANGTGDGHVIWKLGKGGDFSYPNSSDPWPWQSHQHDVEYDPGSTTTISLFDNGNTRNVQSSEKNNRGQVFILDETHRTVTFILNRDIGVYSVAVGSAQRLSNGNYMFLAGIINPAQVVEYNTSGTELSRFGLGSTVYRTYRYRDLYSAPW